MTVICDRDKVWLITTARSWVGRLHFLGKKAADLLFINTHEHGVE